MKKRNWLFILLALVILVGAGVGVYFFQQNAAAAQAATASETTMQTTEARVGDITLTASGAGSITPATQISLGFEDNGTLIELLVEVGDKVQKGQVLARSQTNQTQESIDASIAEAELSILNAQKKLDELYATAGISRTNAMTDITTYAQKVRDAQYTLENYTMPTYLQGMDAIDALDLMKSNLDAASAAFQPYRLYPADNPVREELLAELGAAQSAYDAAVKRLDYEIVLQVAQANLEKARLEYDKYKDGPAADELAIANAELANAKAKLALAQQAQAVEELLSPMDATVMSIAASVGEASGSASVITLANLEQPMLEVYLDESDLDKAVVGYATQIIFDALPDKVFSGKIVAVDPSLSSVSNVKAVRVLVQMDDTDLDVNLPIGLNASVDVIAGEAKGVVLVPVEALRQIDADQYAVFVVENGEPVMRMVEVGLQDITFAEIKSGLTAGETVSTGIVQTK